MNRELESLFAAHDYISREIGMARVEMDDGEFKEGHINGLKEARNRVEQAITEFSECNSNSTTLRLENSDIDDELTKRNEFSHTLATNGYDGVQVLSRDRIYTLAQNGLLDILGTLEHGPLPKEEIAERVGMPETAVEIHLGTLSKLDMVTVDDEERVQLAHQYSVIEPVYESPD